MSKENILSSFKIHNYNHDLLVRVIVEEHNYSDVKANNRAKNFFVEKIVPTGDEPDDQTSFIDDDHNNSIDDRNRDSLVRIIVEEHNYTSLSANDRKKKLSAEKVVPTGDKPGDQTSFIDDDHNNSIDDRNRDSLVRIIVEEHNYTSLSANDRKKKLSAEKVVPTGDKPGDQTSFIDDDHNNSIDDRNRDSLIRIIVEEHNYSDVKANNRAKNFFVEKIVPTGDEPGDQTNDDHNNPIDDPMGLIDDDHNNPIDDPMGLIDDDHNNPIDDPMDNDCGSVENSIEKDWKFLHHAFTLAIVNSSRIPTCFICYKNFSPKSFKIFNMRRHFMTKHSDLMEQSEEFFLRKLNEFESNRSCSFGNSSIHRDALLTSYHIAYLIAKNKKPHDIGEKLIHPGIIYAAKIMSGEEAAKIYSKIPLSNDSVRARINHMAKDITNQLVEKLRGREYGLQLDEATDSNKDAHLICYVRFFEDNSMIEDLLFCKPIMTRATSKNLFQILNSFIIEHNIEWQNCISVCTDGCNSMSGRHNGLKALIRKRAPNYIWNHCYIHRQALASRCANPDLDAVMK
ncbi:SCAN domain-containing protein 3 [Sarcoptes scabiei]|uniref:SCAN domain-containing protein 3 n=1 Tax=Sarcoptes scabiei TaxID=52283 RepID=A0A834R650_SARSC|nr:SCAN domain-containing protein 3 [Sarcoptes scabiei]